MIRNLITSVRSFIAEFRFALFRVRIEREIYGKIFPHLEHERRFAYPFTSDEELGAVTKGTFGEIKQTLAWFERSQSQMPKAYSRAFEFIVCRDIAHQLGKYSQLAARRSQGSTCDRRFVARSPADS